MLDIKALADKLIAEFGREDIDLLCREFSARIPDQDLREVIAALAGHHIGSRPRAHRRFTPRVKPMINDTAKIKGYTGIIQHDYR